MNVGLAGFQIVPRFATYVYYNCRSADVSVQSTPRGVLSHEAGS